MSRNKYYEIFLDEDNKITPESITYFTSKHIYNELSKKDTVKNVVLSDYSHNYLSRFEHLINSCDCVLGFVNDDIYDLYSFSSSHLLKILNNPKNKIIKEKKLVRKEKIKTIDSNTFKWLGTKPGSNIKEKLANTSKVLSTVKRFSNDTKENQVTKSYFKLMYDLMLAKFDFMVNNPNVFNDNLYNERIKKLKIELNKYKQLIRDVFEDVLEKEHSTPNNTLIGNTDYHGIWETYRGLKSITPDLTFSNSYFKFLYKLIMLCFVNSNEYCYIDKYINLFEDNENYLVYKYDGNNIVEIQFDISDEMSLIISEYSIIDNVFEKINEEEILIECNFNDDKNVFERGKYFELRIDSEIILTSFADLIGTKNVLNELCSYFNITLKENKHIDIHNVTPVFVSINSFDNSIYSNDAQIKPHLIMPNILNVPFNNLYYSNHDNLFINSIFDNNYSYVLSLIRNSINLGSHDLLIYDIKDTLDEFSSRDIRRKYSTAFPKSYPVWRSILAGESINDKDNISYVVDMTGKEFYVSRLKRKNNLYIHCGPIELPTFFDKYTEKEFLEDYIELFEEKYDLEYPEEVKLDLLNSGILFEILLKKSLKKRLFIEGNHYEHNYHYIFFDEELFNECLEEFKYRMELIEESYPLENTLYVVPDFLHEICNHHIICNKMLMIGAEQIKDRVLNHKIAWYETLPKLSLEIINNGYFDTLLLVDNQECENIIGKTISFDITEEFTLTAGEDEYILPLNKSFVGEQNVSFAAKLKDNSFPLKKDVKVKLKLKYCFGSENSYELSFVPIEKDAPFKKIIAEWEREFSGNVLKVPNITDVVYTSEWGEKTLAEIKVNIDRLDENYENFVKWPSLKQNQYKFYMKDVRHLSNKFQRLISYDRSYFDYFQNYMIDKHTIDTIKHVRKTKVDEGKIWSFHDVCSMEEAIVMLTLDRDLFIKGKLKYPIACYGRYLSMYPNDEEVIEIALHQMEIFAKRSDYIQSNIPRKFIDRLTSGTACNHMFIEQITKTNPIFTTSLLEFLISTMKYFAETKMVFDMNPETDNKINNPEENIIHMRYILEILISYLFVRENVYFEELKPGGRYAREIIFYLKEFNKNYIDALDVWPENRDKPRMKMKYKMIAKNKPEKLYNMWDELYCVILYLSGSEDVNFIVIEDEESKRD